MFQIDLSRWAARPWMLLPLLVLSMATPPPVNAQEAPRKGTLQGQILDAATGKTLPFANVVFIRVTRENPEGESAGGAMGTADGTYFGKVPAGTYNILFSYISYRSYAAEGIYVAAGQTVTVDARMEPEALVVEKVRVTAEAIRTAEGSMLARLKKAPAVSDAITSDLISKTGDSDAAEAVERVTGISVVGGKYVFVRGLGERYSSTQVNGSAVGTPETNKRVVPLDIFPSSVIDNIIIQKTYTPDLDGDFGGGLVSINTRDFVEGSRFTQSLSLGRTSTSADGYLSYTGGSLDFLGFDDGTRALPEEIRSVDKRLDRSAFSVDERRALTKHFRNTWSPRRESTSPNFGYGGVYSRGFRMFGREAGLLASVSLGNSFRTEERKENTWNSGLPTFTYDVVQSTREVLGGMTANWSLRLREEKPDRVKWNVLYTRSAEDVVKVSEGYNDDFGTDARFTDLAYLERGLLQSVFQGQHTTGLLGSRLDWNLGYSQASRSEPDRRRSVYELGPDSTWVIGGRSGYSLSRIYGEGHEYARSAKLDWTLPLRAAGTPAEAKLRFGYAHSSKDRDSRYRRFGFFCTSSQCNQLDKTLTPEDLVIGEDGETVNYVIEERTLNFDSFVADHRVRAGYGLIDLPVGSWLRAVVGARYEDSRQFLLASSPYAVQGQAGSLEIENPDAEWLPSANLTLTPGKRTNVRLAWARTVNRPELRELSPFLFYNYEKGWEETGNPNLESAQIRNWDTRVEYYAAPGEMLALGVFRKSFDGPIQKFVKPLATGFSEEPRNGRDGWLEGYEAEARVSLTTLYRSLDWLVELGPGEPPRALFNWGLLANYSRIHSAVDLDLGSDGVVTKPFSGQSDYSLNAGVFYRRPRLDTSLLYKAFGDRMVLFSEVSAYRDLTEEPARSLDINVGYQISNATRLKVNASNLLDEETRFVQEGELVSRRYRSGRTFAVALSYEPGSGKAD